MKSCVIFCRVSSKEQAQGFSLSAQERLLKDYCQKSELTPAEIYHISESASKRYIRKKYIEMMNFVIEKNVKCIVVEKTDRILRTLSDYADVKKMVMEHSIEIHFVKERDILKNDSNSHTRLVFGFKALLAENYIDNLSEEAHKGLKEKAEQGYWPHKAPYGYKTVGKNMEPLPEEAERVRKIVRMYLKGMSIDAIRDRMNSLGEFTRNSYRWSKHSIHRILTSPLYSGHFEWRGKRYEGRYEPIVSRLQYAQVREAIERPPTVKRRWRLGGLLVNEHGRRMTGEKQKGRIYYAGYSPTGKRVYVREDDILQHLGREIERVKLSDFLAQEGIVIAREIIAEMSTDSAAGLKAAQRVVGEMDAKLNKLLDLMLSGGLDQKTYLDRSAEMKARKLEAEQEARAYTRATETTRTEIERIIFGMRDLPALYAAGNDDERADVARILVESVEVRVPLKVSVKWAEPWANFVSRTPYLLGNTQVRETTRMRCLRDAIRTTILKMAA